MNCESAAMYAIAVSGYFIKSKRIAEQPCGTERPSDISIAFNILIADCHSSLVIADCKAKTRKLK